MTPVVPVKSVVAPEPATKVGSTTPSGRRDAPAGRHDPGPPPVTVLEPPGDEDRKRVRELLTGRFDEHMIGVNRLLMTHPMLRQLVQLLLVKR